MRHIPNIITFLRIVATPLLAVLLISREFSLALYLVILMGISDAGDGFLAKYYGWQTRLGEFLDPLADKAMLVTTYAIFALQGMLPVWLVAIVIGRDLLIAIGYFYCRFVSGAGMVSLPSRSSKINTFMQVFLVLAVLMKEIGIGPDIIVSVLIALVSVTALVSGSTYALSARQILLRRGLSRAI